MNFEEKQKIANKILDITTRPFMFPKVEIQDPARELFQTMMDKRLEIMAEAYAKLYSDEQLQALFDFHCSEMGKSLYETQLLINKEMRRREPEINKLPETKELNSLDFRAIRAQEGEEFKGAVKAVSGITAKTIGIRSRPLPNELRENINAVYDYKLKILISEEESEEVEVKLSISTNEELKLFTLTTPIEYEFSTSRYYIFYDTLDKGIDVRAELHSNEFKKRGVSSDEACASHGGSSGRGRFIRDLRIPLKMNGGG